MIEIIPRSTWGARYADGGGAAPVPFSEWWLHHSVTIAPDLIPPFDDEYRAMRALEQIGQDRFQQGISYTWPIMPNGRVYQGHSVNRLGAHTGGRNSVARAICFVGNYETTRPTAAQIESAAQLMVREYRAGRATRATLNGGHRDLKATSCPGRFAYESIPLINARATTLIHGGSLMALSDDEQNELLEKTRQVARVLGDAYDPATGQTAGTLLKDIKADTWDVRAALTRDLPKLLAASDPEKVAAAIPLNMAQQVADILGRRLAPAPPQE